MKKIIPLAILLIVVVLSACSKEDGGNNDSKKTTAPEFLDAYYSLPYTMGAEVIKNGSQGPILIKEILIPLDSCVRGYIALNANSKFMAFLGVDLFKDSFTIYDAQIDDYSSMDGISRLNEFSGDSKIDLIHFIRNLNDTDQGQAERMFWGNSVLNDKKPCLNGQHPISYQNWTFWIKNGLPFDQMESC